MIKKPTDLLTVEDVAAEFGWTTARTQRLMRSLGRQGLIWKFEGHRRAYVRRADLEAAMYPSVYEPEVNYSAFSGGTR